MSQGRRRVLSRLLAGFAVFAVLFAAIVDYAQETLFDSKTFSNRAVSVLDDQAVQDKLAAAITDAAIEQAPNAVAARPLIQSVAGLLVRSPALQSLLASGVEDVHSAVIEGNSDTVVVTLANIGVLIRQGLQTAAPKLADQISRKLDIEIVNEGDDEGEGIVIDAAQIGLGPPDRELDRARPRADRRRLLDPPRRQPPGGDPPTRPLAGDRRGHGGDHLAGRPRLARGEVRRGYGRCRACRLQRLPRRSQDLAPGTRGCRDSDHGRRHLDPRAGRCGRHPRAALDPDHGRPRANADADPAGPAAGARRPAGDPESTGRGRDHGDLARRLRDLRGRRGADAARGRRRAGGNPRGRGRRGRGRPQRQRPGQGDRRRRTAARRLRRCSASAPTARRRHR